MLKFLDLWILMLHLSLGISTLGDLSYKPEAPFVSRWNMFEMPSVLYYILSCLFDIIENHQKSV